MKGSLDYVRWSRETAEERQLSRGQAQVLQSLGSFVNRRGECFPGTQKLAGSTRLSRRHVCRLLRELEDLELVRTRRRGNGKTAMRQLLVEPVDPQLAFDFDAPTESAAPAPAASSLEQEQMCHSGQGDVPSGVSQKEQTEGAVEEEEGVRAARARSAGVSTTLTQVLEVLEAAPRLMVEPLAVDAALRAYPEPTYDHLSAAHVVVSWAHEGGLAVPAANRLLLAELRKQHTRRGGGKRRPGWPPKPGTQGRRRAPGHEPEEQIAARHAEQRAATDRLLAGSGFWAEDA